jgi:hypothetical protein
MMSTTADFSQARAADERSGFEQMATLLRYFLGWLRPREAQIQISYLIPERGGFGWYVVCKSPAFDFELNKQLAEFGAALIRKGFAIHATLLPGSVPGTVPTDGIAISPLGQVATYAD